MLHIGGAIGQVEDPLLEHPPQAVLGTDMLHQELEHGDIEIPVSGQFGGMAPVGLLDDGADPETGDDRMVRARFDDVVIDQVFTGNDDGLAGKAGMDRGAQTPSVCVAEAIGPLHVQQADIGIASRDDGELLPRKRAGDDPEFILAHESPDVEDIRQHNGGENRHEGISEGAGSHPRCIGEIAVVLHFEASRPLVAFHHASAPASAPFGHKSGTDLVDAAAGGHELAVPGPGLAVVGEMFFPLPDDLKDETERQAFRVIAADDRLAVTHKTANRLLRGHFF